MFSSKYRTSIPIILKNLKYLAKWRYVIHDIVSHNGGLNFFRVCFIAAVKVIALMDKSIVVRLIEVWHSTRPG